MNDTPDKKEDNNRELKQEKIEIQPEKKSEKPNEPETGRPEKSSEAETASKADSTAAEPTTTAPKATAPKATAPKAAAPKTAAPKAAAPKTAAPKAAAKKPTPKPTSSASSITFDDEAESKGTSMPILIIDGLAAAVAVAFTILILQDVLPFLK